MTLVTGATGCLGSNITKALVARGERAAILRRSEDPVRALGTVSAMVEHRFGDVRDIRSVELALDGVEKIYHVAGVTEPINSARELMRSTNVEGTENVARCALRQGIHRLVYTSSVAAIGFPDDGNVADEAFPFNGDRFPHAYVDTKHEAEAVIARYVAQGLDAVIVNPAAVMAPGGSLKYSWAGLVLKISEGKMPFYPPGGLGVVTSSDVVNGHLLAMEKGKPGDRYILNSVNLTYRELFHKIASVVGAKPPQSPCPKPLLYAIGHASSCLQWFGVDPGNLSYMVRENIPMLVRRLYYSPLKAVRELGLSLTRLEESIQETYDWCHEHAR